MNAVIFWKSYSRKLRQYRDLLTAASLIERHSAVFVIDEFKHTTRHWLTVGLQDRSSFCLLEKGVQFPELILSQFLGKRMIMALSTVDLFSKKQPSRDGSGGCCLVIEMGQQKIGGTIFIAATFGRNQLSNCLDPWPVVAKLVRQKRKQRIFIDLPRI